MHYAGNPTAARRCLALAICAVLLTACAGGDEQAAPTATTAGSASNVNALANDLSGQLGPTVSRVGGVMELTIEGIGTAKPTTEVKWLAPDLSTASSAGPRAAKLLAIPFALPGFLDVAGVSSSTIDIDGFRYIAATIKVRNAPQCPAVPGPGNCSGYPDNLGNATFMAVLQQTTLNGTAVSRFNRFDGTPANPLLTTQLLPAHGLNGSLVVNPDLASMQVYTEDEVALMAPDIGVNSILPYGFVVRNVNDNSRTLPALPNFGQYDGRVTFGFRIPVQPVATDDPFKISLRFQTIYDGNRRVTQSLQERSFAGDIAATRRATTLGPNDQFFNAGGSEDLAVLGGRLAQTPIGNPICRVRTAGTAGAPSAFLVNNIFTPPNLAAAPANLSFVGRRSSISIGFCETVSPPTESSFVLEGSQSGRRKFFTVGPPYKGFISGGIVEDSRSLNQLTWEISQTAGHRPFFPGEEVRFTATSANLAGGVPITPFVGSFRVKGSTPSSAMIDAGEFPVGISPVATVIGDVNGNGLLDLVTVNQGANTVSVSLGNGAGGFAPPIDFGVGILPTAVALGDINGDGWLDIVASNFVSSDVSVLLNNTSGGFAPAVSFGVGTNPLGVALGDVNGDGHLDIVTANSNANSVSVRLGNGVGGFAAAATFSVGTRPFSVAVGDLNNDGRLDIVTANFNSANVSVLLGSGAGSFISVGNVAVGTRPLSVALGDMNNDGKLDIVAVNRDTNNVSTLLGLGAGIFTTASTVAVGISPHSVAIGDINGDGILDLAVANNTSNSVTLLYGNGAGGYAAPNNVQVGSGPAWVALGDVNGDERLDIVTSNININDVSVRTGI